MKIPFQSVSKELKSQKMSPNMNIAFIAIITNRFPARPSPAVTMLLSTSISFFFLAPPLYSPSIPPPSSVFITINSLLKSSMGVLCSPSFLYNEFSTFFHRKNLNTSPIYIFLNLFVFTL